MKRLLMVVLTMTALFAQQAVAMTEMSDAELDAVTAQAGFSGETLPASLPNAGRPPAVLPGIFDASRQLASLGSAFNLPEGTRETQIVIEDAVIDIDHISLDLLKTKDFSIGHIGIDGFHMEIASATISIWAH